MSTKTLGDRLRRLRRNKKESQAELGAAIKVTEAAISQWETGKTEPSHANIVSLVQHYDASFRWLMTGEGVPMVGELRHAVGLVSNQLPRGISLELDDNFHVRINDARHDYLVVPEHLSAFGERLKWLRTKYQETPADLAAACNVSEAIAAQWETGESQPTLANLVAAIKHYDVSYRWMLTGTGTPDGELRHAILQSKDLVAIKKLIASNRKLNAEQKESINNSIDAHIAQRREMIYRLPGNMRSVK
jgi:transcriptional regulator with XRE-family HTH domain